MSSIFLENTVKIPQRSGDRFLLLLKTRGPLTSAQMGASLNITDEAARQQLIKHAKEGFVEGISEANGVGRPQQVWHLTQAGHAQFPDAHAELTVQLLRTIRTELGEAALDRLIGAREEETRTSYRAEMADMIDLQDKVARLAAIRTREGYMADWSEDGDGYLLVENHCPICAAATLCQGFCRAELSVFQEVLGDEAQVTRVEHIPAGARRCAYRVTHKADSPC